MPSAVLLDVAEIFASLQGEGPFMGQPAVFVRLAGCLPPFCPWCDTPHALGGGTAMSPAAVLEAVVRHPHRLVVITGGEPFRQWRSGLAELADMLAGAGRTLQYETSGKAGIPEGHRGVVVCSPKPGVVPEGISPHALYLAPEFVARADAFKFVLDPEAGSAGTTAAANGLQPILHFIRANAVDPSRVWLMPLGRRREEQAVRMAGVWEICMRYGFNFAPRLHILTFDDTRGI